MRICLSPLHITLLVPFHDRRFNYKFDNYSEHMKADERKTFNRRWFRRPLRTYRRLIYLLSLNNTSSIRLNWEPSIKAILYNSPELFTMQQTSSTNQRRQYPVEVISPNCQSRAQNRLGNESREPNGAFFVSFHHLISFSDSVKKKKKTGSLIHFNWSGN